MTTKVPISQPAKSSSPAYHLRLVDSVAASSLTVMTTLESVPSFDALAASLLDLSQPMGKRTRAVFYLRTRGQKADLQVLLQGVLRTLLPVAFVLVCGS